MNNINRLMRMKFCLNQFLGKVLLSNKIYMQLVPQYIE